MELEELKKKIYKPESELEDRLKKSEIFKSPQKEEKYVPEKWEIEKKPQKAPLFNRKKYWQIGGALAIVVSLGLIAFLAWWGLTSFDEKKVEIKIEGPDRTVSGEEVNYVVIYRNNTRTTLEDIQLTFYYPENSIVPNQQDLVQTFDLPDLQPSQESQIKLPVRIVGFKQEAKEVKAELSYQPEKISSRFSNQAEFSTIIFSVPLMVDFSLPEKLVSGQSFDFSLRYINQGETSLEDLEISMEFPQGFTLTSADPEAKEDNLWQIDSLLAGEESRIFMRGNIEGEKGESKSFKAQLAKEKEGEKIPYTQTARSLTISLSPLFVSQTINNAEQYITRAGDKLNYQINFENTTDVGISNIVINAKIEGAALNFEELDLQEGSFDSEKQAISWKASNLPLLEYLGPHQKGAIKFSVKIKDPIPINNYSDKNFTITNTVEIDSSDKPIALRDIEISGRSQLVTKIASGLRIKSQGYYHDEAMPGSGPIPPKVGETTTYTIKWRLLNSINDLSSVVVEASLPPHVKWLNQKSPNSADLRYQSSTGKLVWQVGDLPSLTGFLSPVKEVSFRVSITPSQVHLGSLMELIGQTKVTGHDNFTSLELIDTSRIIDTSLPDDLNINLAEGTVVK